MRSEYSANLAMQSQPRNDWRAVLAKRDANRAIRRARVAQDARSVSFTSIHVGAIIFLGSIGSAVAQILGRSA